MTAGGEVSALVAAAPAVGGEARAAFEPVARELAEAGGGIGLVTCHRVEVYLPAAALPAGTADALPPAVTRLTGRAAARRLISLAIGLESTILAEDQVLHQLRAAVAGARSRAPLDPPLETLLELALRAGRRARSWRPGPPRSLADLALERAATLGARIEGRRVLVVGAGQMGRLAARAASARGATVRIASRTTERAGELARAVGGEAVVFDPGPGLVRDAAAVVVALAGRWTIGKATLDALARGPVVVDLSQPAAVPALPSTVRVIRLDDLATGSADEPTSRYRRRLEALRDDTLAEYEAWLERRAAADVARALAGRIEQHRRRELEALWRRHPDLGAREREAIEAVTSHLAERLFREPFERLGRDRDGRRVEAARELFGL